LQKIATEESMTFRQFDSGDAGPTASSARHAQKFPFCGRYLINWMNPQVLKGKVPKRWAAFVKWCGDESRAVEACTWGKGPLVQINSQAVGRANGRYKGGDVVFVHGKVADKYESGDGWIIWESTVLHELIHWARYKGHLTDGNLEVGQEFEKEAYGQLIELTTPWRPGP
jgi:zincin-like metallopeptidase toxin 3 of polymorphic toxin system